MSGKWTFFVQTAEGITYQHTYSGRSYKDAYIKALEDMVDKNTAYWSRKYKKRKFEQRLRK
jgi:hypothetical protein